MSGFERKNRGVFGLTWTKARYWHSYRTDGCPCDDLDDYYARHIEPAGFQRLDSPSPALLRVSGPGLDQHNDSHLWESMTGQPSRFPTGTPWEKPAPKGR